MPEAQSVVAGGGVALGLCGKEFATELDILRTLSSSSGKFRIWGPTASLWEGADLDPAHRVSLEAVRAEVCSFWQINARSNIGVIFIIQN